MVVKKRGLGKGLSALIPGDPVVGLLNEEPEKDSVLKLDIELVEPNEDQPRQKFEKDSLHELTASIEMYGVIQPIVVRKKGNKYQIVAGERRWRAAKAANLKKIPCIIKDIDEKEAMKLALIENIQRQDLNPIEEAFAFQGLMKEYHLTQEEVAKSIGKSRSYIANTIRLLKLDKEIKDYIAEGKITSGHGRALLSIDNEEERRKVAESIVNKKINVRDTESMIKNRKKSKPKVEDDDKDPLVREVEDNLMRTLGTKVKLTTKKDGGKIEIQFYDYEDLQRLIELITN
ncbi:MAG: ParB/RepB/Spo0J family partition protein [Tissierellia bacterium]|nr:ParB/RepB/Spo0J family partition protein [Tissierellia bacterium]